MTNAIQSSDPLSNYVFDASASTNTKESELGQDAFMTLMLEQLKNQDPLKPQENGEFLAQMAQFSTVTGINEMQASIDNLAASMNHYQVLQSASLVGHSVLVPTNQFNLTDDNVIEGVYENQYSATNLTASIYNTGGELVHTIELGAASAGEHSFSWDGLLEDGERADPGTYSVTVSYGTGDDVAVADVQIQQIIDSVNFSTGDGEILLNTEDGQSLSLSDISQIH